ncbi:PH domain-containing protein [Lentibacillus saliphilus]|uniref:PH domain-containing protein n=1 Tax=Lentibacillus saliphilus TaxID=2737028 RepID=UPI001C2FD65E|nr:PH domain-containing protein [Lentibacillus saliphilus]
MKFHAKKDMTFRILIWGSVLLFLGLSVGLFIPIYHEAGFAASITFSFIFGIFVIIILWLWYRTFYVVTNEHLIIHIGPFKRRVELNTIKKIEKSNVPLASVALSKERYFLYYNANDYTIIAPENIEKFVEVVNEKRKEPIRFLK